MSRDQAIVMRYDSPDEGGDSRDIVYLHGRGSTEREAGFALSLFGNANVRAYRGPIAQGGGFAWFLNAGTGTAVPQSLAHETAKIGNRSEEHTSELQSLMRISYAVFCLKKKKH